MYFLYSSILALGMLAAIPYWLYLSLHKRDFRASIAQRLGLRLPAVDLSRHTVWLHAVSVGEVLAAKALCAALRQARPDVPLVVSTVTLTGHALAQKELSDAAAIFYFPLDFSFCVSRFLSTLRPFLVVIMETELWPNFLKGCVRQNIPVLLANARISDKSVHRYRYIRRMARAMVGALARIGAQTQADRERFLAMGAREEQVVVTGNLKFDFPTQSIDSESAMLHLIRSALGLQGGDPVVVVGSSRKGEETLLLDQFLRLRRDIPSAKLILAPRHPGRFNEVADLLSATGVRWLRRTELGEGKRGPADILLLDSVGELRAVYSLATVAVIGGSFLPYGGHNLLEPAALGKPVVFGPEMSNFRELARLFLRERAARQCAVQELASILKDLLRNPEEANLIGRRAAEAYRMNQGATDNTMRFILPYVC